MIRFDHVSFEYEEGVPVFEDLCFSIRAGESVGLIGANGSGKSTLMKLMLGLLPFTGSILVGGLPVCRENLVKIRRMLGLVLQNSDNQMFMPTVLQDILFAPLNYGLSREAALRRADEALSFLGISDLKAKYNHKLSGGEKRMAAIAAVLAMQPEMFLMDEPTSALDPRNRRIVINAVRSLPNTRLIASHDLDMILDTCDRVLLLSGGRIAADGDAGAILHDEALLLQNHLELPLRFQ